MEFAKNIHWICDLMSSTRKGFHVLANSLEDFMLLVFFWLQEFFWERLKWNSFYNSQSESRWELMLYPRHRRPDLGKVFFHPVTWNVAFTGQVFKDKEGRESLQPPSGKSSVIIRFYNRDQIRIRGRGKTGRHEAGKGIFCKDFAPLFLFSAG